MQFLSKTLMLLLIAAVLIDSAAGVRRILSQKSIKKTEIKRTGKLQQNQEKLGQSNTILIPTGTRNRCVTLSIEPECLGNRFCKWETDQWKVGRCTHKRCPDWKLQDQCLNHKSTCMECRPDEKTCVWNPSYVSPEMKAELRAFRQSEPVKCFTVPTCSQINNEENCKENKQYCMWRPNLGQCVKNDSGRTNSLPAKKP